MEVLRKMSQTFLHTFKNFQNFLRREISKREKCRKRLQTSISRESERENFYDYALFKICSYQKSFSGNDKEPLRLQLSFLKGFYAENCF